MTGSLEGAGYYSAYGLLIYSEVALSHFGSAKPGQPDVVVRIDSVPPNLPTPKRVSNHWQAAPDDFLLSVPNKCRFRVMGGNEILVEYLDDEDVTVYIVSSVWTALLQQRGFLTLHASTVMSSNGAVLILGHSGAGKSTLAAALTFQGLDFLTDDVAAVRIGTGGRLEVMPGYPCLRLSGNAFEQLELSTESVHTRDGIEKYLLPVKNLTMDPQPISRAYILSKAHSAIPDFAKLKPAEVLEKLLRFTHRRRYMEAFGVSKMQFQSLTAFSREVPTAVLRRYPMNVAPKNLASLIRKHLDNEFQNHVHSSHPANCGAVNAEPESA